VGSRTKAVAALALVVGMVVSGEASLVAVVAGEVVLLAGQLLGKSFLGFCHVAAALGSRVLTFSMSFQPSKLRGVDFVRIFVVSLRRADLGRLHDP